MKNAKYKITLLVSVLIYGLDQWTKWLVVKHIPMGSGFPVFESWLDLVHFRNRGAAFGFLSDWQSGFRDIFFYILSFFAILFLFQILRQIPESKKTWSISVGLILGGALGNISDRISRGSVVDFIYCHWNHQSVSFSLMDRFFSFDLVWPAFNVADAAITVGVVCLMFVLSAIQSKKEKEK